MKKRHRDDILYQQAKQLREDLQPQIDAVHPPESLNPEQFDNILKRGQNLMQESKAKTKQQRKRSRMVWYRAAAAAMALILVVGVGVYGLDRIGQRNLLHTDQTENAESSDSGKKTVQNVLDGTGIITVAESYGVGSTDYSPIAEYAKQVQKNIEKENKKFNYFGFTTDKAESSTATADDAMPESANESGMAAESPDYSDTNNQVQNVQEGDIVKTDGNFLYVLSAKGNLVCKQVQPDGSLTDGGSVSLTSNADGRQFLEMFLYDGTAAVVMQCYKEKPQVRVELYKNDGSGKLTAAGSYAQEGNYVSGRIAKGALYLVTNEYAFSVYDGGSDIEIPVMWSDDVARKVTTEEMYITCCPGYDMTYTNITGYRFGEDTGSVKTVSVLGSSASEIYCTEENLYLLATNYEWQKMTGDFGGEVQTTTSVYRYGLQDGQIAAKAQGKVTGWMLNQFSADEHNGYFRIATTDESACRVTVLEASSLQQVSQLTGLAEGERIYACKFMGNTAYLVTFYQTDPLFVLDLSDVKNMKILGEVELPGYSSYLYPFGESYLIGVGRNADNDGRVNGLRINLFDVSDPQNPRLADAKILYGDCYALAGETHKAYYTDPANGIFGFPLYTFTRQTGLENFNGFVLFGVENGKLSVAKEIDFIKESSNLNWDTEYYTDYAYNGYYIDRGIYIGDTLYLVANEQIYTYTREDFAYLRSFDLD